jgi:uncharacterized protein (DUF305 family)
MPGDDSPEAGFARDMATHHAQAVDMAFIVRDASSDPELRSLAYDIIVTQTAQRGMFMGWLQEWELPQASDKPRMAWMPGHAQAAADSSSAPVPMHGMASAEQMARLQAASGSAAEVQFLQLMIRHHEGGVLMARAVLPLTTRGEVLSIAKAIDTGQTAEIALMTRMLASRGAEPLPSLLK